jgi:hypothetical protein
VIITVYKFTGKERDAESGLDDFEIMRGQFRLSPHYSTYDLNTADTLGVPSFLGTPEGRITMYNPANPFAPLPIIAGPPW